MSKRTRQRSAGGAPSLPDPPPLRGEGKSAPSPLEGEGWGEGE